MCTRGRQTHLCGRGWHVPPSDRCLEGSSQVLMLTWPADRQPERPQVEHLAGVSSKGQEAAPSAQLHRNAHQRLATVRSGLSAPDTVALEHQPPRLLSPRVTVRGLAPALIIPNSCSAGATEMARGTIPRVTHAASAPRVKRALKPVNWRRVAQDRLLLNHDPWTSIL